MQPIFRNSVTFAGVVLLGLLPLAVAHGHDGDMAMDMNIGKGEPSIVRPTIPSEPSNLANTEPLSYFQYGEHSGLMFAHILLMTIGWVFVLPIGEHL